MTEKHVYYARIATELSKLNDKERLHKAQYYLVYGCQIVDKKMIDIAVAFGGDFEKKGSNNQTPLQILHHHESKLKGKVSK